MLKKEGLEKSMPPLCEGVATSAETSQPSVHSFPIKGMYADTWLIAKNKGKHVKVDLVNRPAMSPQLVAIDTSGRL